MRIGNEQMDLKLCLIDSAQCFQWKPLEDGYVSVLQNNPVFLYEENGICAEGALEPAALRNYLDLDRDYQTLSDEFSKYPAAKAAIEMYPGLRILNQDPWETLISFILSANNNVARIQSLVNAIRENLGEKYCFRGVEVNGFPSPEALAQTPEARLRSLGVGYRAPYLIKTARQVADGFPLWELKKMDYHEAHALLTKLSGVGDKVADCVLLFGCGHTAAFPVDVWVEKLLKSWFDMEICGRKKMMCRAQEMLGPNAGLLQQFLFHAARMGDLKL